MKKILIALLLGTTMLFAGCSGSPSDIRYSSDSAEEAVSSQSEESTGTADTADVKSIFPQTLDDLSRIYTFKIDDKVISLPSTMEEMRSAGLSLDGYVYSDKVPANTSVGVSLYNSEGAEFKTNFYGNPDTDTTLEEAHLIEIDVMESQAEKLGIRFETADGITFGDSIDKVVKLYGGEENISGGEIHEDKDGKSVTYRFSSTMSKLGMIEEDQILSYSFDHCSFIADSDGRINRIVMSYLPE